MPNHGEKETRPMNFIFLFSDQHSPHMLGCYGNEAVRTPHLDALAARGARFANACCNCPVCVPSRAAMAMGDYASRGGYWDNAFAYDGAEPSWAGRLEEEGYRVTAIGKMHFKDDSPATGFLDQRIPLHIKDGKGDIYGTIRDKTITRPQFRQAILDAREGESDYSRFDREVARRAADFLTREAAGEGRPFALYVGFVTPHFPLIAPPEYAALYPDAGSVRTPVAFDRAHWADHPVLNDYRRYCCQEGLTDAQRLNAVRIYYALCSFLDAQVGTVLDAVTQAGLWENTCVVSTGCFSNPQCTRAASAFRCCWPRRASPRARCAERRCRWWTFTPRRSSAWALRKTRARLRCRARRCCRWPAGARSPGARCTRSTWRSAATAARS